WVETIREAESIHDVVQCLDKTPVNAIFIDPIAVGLEAAAAFIFKLRKMLPQATVCLYAELSEVERQASSFYEGERQRFRHYYVLNKDLDEEAFNWEAGHVAALCSSDVRVFSELERMRIQRSFYLDSLPPPELHNSLKDFRDRFPLARKTAFIVMS